MTKRSPATPTTQIAAFLELPEALKNEVEASALATGRSVKDEIVVRLYESASKAAEAAMLGTDERAKELALGGRVRSRNDVLLVDYDEVSLTLSLLGDNEKEELVDHAQRLNAAAIAIASCVRSAQANDKGTGHHGVFGYTARNALVGVEFLHAFVGIMLDTLLEAHSGEQ